jgi:hypothetical protein
VLSAWLDAVPDGDRGQPEAMLLAAIVGLEGRPSAAVQLFAAAIEVFRAAGDPEGELMALVQWTGLAFRQGDLHGIARHIAHTQELAGEGFEAARAVLCLGRAMVALLAGDWDGALATLDSVREHTLTRDFRQAIRVEARRRGLRVRTSCRGPASPMSCGMCTLPRIEDE